VVSDTRKFDRGLTTLLHDELHWLDVPERVTYKLGVMMYRCVHSLAPRYLADQFTPASDVPSRLRLRSANRNQLVVPCCRLNTYGPSGVFDCRSDGLEFVAAQAECVLTVLNSFFLVSTNVTSALEVFLNDMRYINSRFTYLLTLWPLFSPAVVASYAFFRFSIYCSVLKPERLECEWGRKPGQNLPTF